MSGIFSGVGGSLGYFAQPDRTPKFDFGPTQDWTAGGRESRQIYERGMADFLAHTRESRRRTPLDPQDTPALRRYQARSQQLQHLDPAMAHQLTRGASQVALMEQRRRGRRMLFNGLGYAYWVTPALGPGGYLLDAARAGRRI